MKRKDWQADWKDFLLELGPELVGDHWPTSSPSAKNQTALAMFLPENVMNTDTLTKEITSDIIDWLKTFFDPEDPGEYFSDEYYLKAANKKVVVEFNVKVGKTGTGMPFFIDTGVYGASSEEPSIEINMDFDARYPIEQHLEDIYFKVLEDVRHEIEHSISGLPGGNRDLSRGEYYLDKGEIPSMVRGLHLKAKKMKVPVPEMFRRELELYLKSGEISQQEHDTIFDAWSYELDKIQGKV